MNENIINLIIQAKNLSSNTLNQVKGQLADLTKASESLAKDGFDKIGGAVSKTTELMKGAVIGGGILAATFAGIGFNNAVQIQSQMADVQKSAGLTGSEISGLRDKILDLSTTTQTKAFDLIGIAKIGGAIGVAKDDLLAFTSSIDKVSTALGDEFTGGAEEVSSKLGTLRNLFKGTAGIAYSDAMMRIGSSINSLGASGTATGPVVAEFASRIGQLGPALSPSITETLGLGAAFQELGLSAEISSSGLSNILLTAGNKAPKFAEQMGISTQAFDELIKKSPNEMLLQLAKSFENIADDPIKLAQTMTTLGIGSQEATKVMSLLSSKTDLVRGKQKLASEEFQKGTSILDEYNIKNNTMSALFGKAQNVFTKFSSALWNSNLGAIGDQFQRLIDYVAKFDFGPAISKTTEFVDNLKNIAGGLDLFGKNLELTKTVFAGVAGVIGTVLVGSLVSLAWSATAAALPFVALGLAFSALYVAFQNQELIIKTLQDYWGQFSSKMTEFGSFLANVFKPELETLNSIWKNFIEIMKTLWNNLQPLIAIIYILATQALQAVFYAFEQLRQPMNDFIQAIFNIARPIIDILAPAFVFIVGLIFTILIPVFQLVWAVVVQAFKGILEIITGVINIVSGILNVFIGVIKGLFTGDFSQVIDGFKQLWQGLEQFFWGILDILLSPIRGIIDGIGNIFKGFNLAQIGVDMMANLADGLWGAVDIAMGPINWLMDQVNAVLGKQSQAEANAYKSSQPVSGKGSVSQYGFAKGGAFQGGNVVAFADGGVVNKPTNFAMSGGRLGLMGEAGAEAIMPLSRGKDGKLGVKAEGTGGITFIMNNPTFLSGDQNAVRQVVKMMEDELQKLYLKFGKLT